MGNAEIQSTFLRQKQAQENKKLDIKSQHGNFAFYLRTITWKRTQFSTQEIKH